MKLSEAIREGAKLRPQAFSALFCDGKTCALGAACDAVGAITWRGDKGELTGFVPSHYFPALEDPDLYLAITRMNDFQRMTREQIADWVEEQGY